MLSREIILGTGSIIRRQILSEMGYTFTTMTADLDERNIGNRSSDNDAPALVSLLAKSKSDAIIGQLVLRYPDEAQRRANCSSSLLITADSVATYEGSILEKPEDLEQARSFLVRYGSGSPLSIVSGICVTDIMSGARVQGVDISSASFNKFSDEAIEALLSEGKVLKAAGGIMIEHPVILPFVREIVGSIDGIQGLPKDLTETLIKQVAAMR